MNTVRIEIFSILTIALTACTQIKSDPSPMNLVGGTKAGPGDFPSVFIWSAGDVNLTSSFCTGTKVSATKILTAAHCVLIQDQAEIPYTGAWRRDESIKVGKKIKFSPERVLTRTCLEHPDS